MLFPEDLYYTAEHEWLRVEDGEAVIGITAYAAGQLGDIVYLDIPFPAELWAGQTFGTIEAVKTVSDLYSPLTGVLAEVNPALQNSPELVNSDPYGAGWLIRMRIAEPAPKGSLLSAGQYEKLTGPVSP